VEDLSDVFGIELVGVRKRARKTKPPGILGTSRLRRTKK
jgi:hypothetical protein